MAGISVTDVSVTDNGTNLTVTGTYTATFTPTAVKLAMDYQPTLTANLLFVANPNNPAILNYTTTATVSGLPLMTATAPTVSAPFSVTVQKSALEPQAHWAMDFHGNLNQILVTINLAPNIPTLSGSGSSPSMT
jgi:hypothetical protein